MPRPKIIERRRCLKACEGCKKRKEKCDGVAPCSPCKKRRLEARCLYLQGSSGSQPRTNSRARIPSTDSELRPASAQAVPEQTWSSPTEDEEDRPETPTGTIGAPVPKDSRLVTDATGQYVYLGNSASPSFLHNIRLIVANAMAPCDFTTDSHQNHIVEAVPQPEEISPRWPETLSGTEAVELALCYRIAVSGALDLFDRHTLAENVKEFAQDPARSHWPTAASLYLVLGLGAQARAQDGRDENIARSCFALGCEQATAALRRTPDIFMVQACCMVAWYLLTASRRSTATMYLGLAVQAAYNIGLHRQEANAVFGSEDRRFRERVWKSLRVCDVFLSATLGRPSTTSHVACNVDWNSSAKVHEDNNELSRPEQRHASAISRLCLIFEQILSVVYSTQRLSLRSARSISERHRKWTVDFSETSKADSLSPGTNDDFDAAVFFGSSTLLMAYHYSIILLTRPFLTLHVKTCVNQRLAQVQARKDHVDVMTYSDACVSSALKMIDLAYDFSVKPLSPKRTPLLTNSTFISALSLGLAYFGNYKSSEWPLETAMSRATTVLQRLGNHSPQAARHSEIIGQLWSAAKRYEQLYKDNTMQVRNQRVSEMFGIVSIEQDSSAGAILKAPDLLIPDLASTIQSSVRARANETSLLSDSDMATLGVFETEGEQPSQTALSMSSHNANGATHAQSYLYPQSEDQLGFLAGITPPDLYDFALDDQAPLFYIASDLWGNGH